MRNILNYLCKKLCPKVSEDKLYYLHNYSTYEEYLNTQIRYNKMKIDHIWADEDTLQMVSEKILSNVSVASFEKKFGICHGTRNGFEQSYLKSVLGEDWSVIGTDISDTAEMFTDTIQWDFHKVRESWVGVADFVYSNSLDQACDPNLASRVWVDQLKCGGLLIIEHTDGHGPKYASEMDPFGAVPEYMPFLFSKWLGMRVSIESIPIIKKNNNFKGFLFVLKKNY